MNIVLTFDYELFFGESVGTVKKCLIDPTERLLQLSIAYQAKMTFFLDVGYLIKLEEYSTDFPELVKDREAIYTQISEILKSGNDIQLHIHPHWEKSTYINGTWNISADGAYKLHDFSDDEISRIVRTYKAYLDNLTGQTSTVFRAGGWCIQPFSRLKNVFVELGLRVDTSVFSGGKFFSDHYSYDFTRAPRKSFYHFEEDVCLEIPDGYFTEFPISSWKYSPLFYWRLYMLGRLFPGRHKMVGDGIFLSQPGRKIAVLTHFTWNHVSTDGYYASKLNSCLKYYNKNGFSDMVTIGHPKSMTEYSFEKLKKFLMENHKKHHFFSFKELL